MRFELTLLDWQPRVITSIRYPRCFGGPGGNRTLNSGLQNQCFPISTTGPNWRKDWDLNPGNVAVRRFLLIWRRAEDSNPARLPVA